MIEETEFDYESRIVSIEMTGDDTEVGVSLRPKTFEDYIGQEKVKEMLKVYIDAAKGRGDSLDHVLLYGPPGLGKTTLSGIIANEMGVNFKAVSVSSIEKPSDLAVLLTNLAPGDVLFIDEIHRLSRVIEELLHQAMEDYVLDIIIGKGPAARNVRIPLSRFTLIGTTTNATQLTTQLCERFGIFLHLEPYKNEELATIIKRFATVSKIKIDDEGALEIASRSRGTPRIANRLLKRVFDYAQVKGNGKITIEIAKTALKSLEINEFSLNNIEKS